MIQGWRWNWVGAILIGALAACSSSGGEGGGVGSGGTSSLDTGRFVDSPVQGLRYETPTQSGFTDANGQFSFLPGERVTFFLGQNILGPVTATSQVTPWTVFGPDTSPIDPRAINLARVLLSLDTVAGSDRITVGSAVNNAVGQLNFSQSATDFGTDPAVAQFLSNAAGGSLVSEQVARAHLQGQFAYIGSWSDSETPSTSPAGLSMLSFLPDGSYVIYSEKPGVPGGAGMERGRLSYDPLTGNFTWTVLTNTDGADGLSGTAAPGNLHVLGDLLSLHYPNDPTPGPFPRYRVNDPGTPNPIVGSWVGTSPDNPSAVIVVTFFPDGTLTYVEDNEPTLSPGGQDGVERGTYVFDAGTGLLSTTINLDTNGQWGFHSSGPLPSAWGPFAVIRNGNDNISVNVPGEPAFSLTRVKAFGAAPLPVFSTNSFVAQGIYSSGPCQWNNTATFTSVVLTLNDPPTSGSMSFTGSAILTPVSNPDTCLASTGPLSFVIPITLNGSQFQGTLGGGTALRRSVIGSINGSTAAGTYTVDSFPNETGARITGNYSLVAQ